MGLATVAVLLFAFSPVALPGLAAEAFKQIWLWESASGRNFDPNFRFPLQGFAVALSPVRIEFR